MPMDLILPCDGTDELPVHAATAMPPADAASAPATRFLTIGRARFALDPKMAAALAAWGYVYDCNDPGQSDHPPSDLHLMPEGPRDEGWDTDDVCRLAVILLGGTPDAPAAIVPALAFDAWQATRREVTPTELAEFTGMDLADMSPLGGYVYDGGCWIEKHEGGQYWLIIGNRDWLDTSLPKLERILYERWYEPEAPAATTAEA